MYTIEHRRHFPSVHPTYMDQKVDQIPTSRHKPRRRLGPLGKTCIRSWRKYHELSLQDVVDRMAYRLKTTHASLSRIERGLQPYNQRLLEALGEALRTDPASLLVRNPRDPEGIWAIWNRASPTVKLQILAIAETLIKTDT